METQTVPQVQRTYLVINGRNVEALTVDRLSSIVNGMIGKKKLFAIADNGGLFKGFAITGNGNAVDTPLGTRYIYNVDMLSEIAMLSAQDASHDGNPDKQSKARKALLSIGVALEHGDVQEIHDSCRAYLNAITVSFSVATQKFTSGSLVQGVVDVITTDNGSLISLKNVSEVKAVSIESKPAGKKIDFYAALGIAAPAPKETVAIVDPVATAKAELDKLTAGVIEEANPLT